MSELKAGDVVKFQMGEVEVRVGVLIEECWAANLWKILVEDGPTMYQQWERCIVPLGYNIFDLIKKHQEDNYVEVALDTAVKDEPIEPKVG